MTRHQIFERLLLLAEESREAAPATHAALHILAASMSMDLDEELLGLMTAMTDLIRRIGAAERGGDPFAKKRLERERRQLIDKAVGEIKQHEDARRSKDNDR